MKHQADKDRANKTLEVGKWALVKLQLFRQQSLAKRINKKVFAKSFGPFMVLAKIGTVAYKLQLLEALNIHPVLLISQLKEKFQEQTIQSTMPSTNEHGFINAEPVAVLIKKLGRKGHKAVVYVLIQWSNTIKEEAMWELYTNIEKKFLKFSLEA